MRMLFDGGIFVAFIGVMFGAWYSFVHILEWVLLVGGRFVIATNTF